MSTLKDLAIQLATTNLVADLVAEHKDQLREQMANAFNELGSDSVKVQIGDEKIGKVTLIEPKAKAIIDSEIALIFWVQENHKSEMVNEIRPSFKKYILDNVEILDDGTAVLITTGEIVPGITGRKTAPYVSTRFDTDGREKLGRALQTGEVGFALPTINNGEITGGNDE
jgi:hypothetical protein